MEPGLNGAFILGLERTEGAVAQQKTPGEDRGFCSMAFGNLQGTESLGINWNRSRMILISREGAVCVRSFTLFAPVPLSHTGRGRFQLGLKNYELLGVSEQSSTAHFSTINALAIG